MNRQPGYYWVKIKDGYELNKGWRIAKYLTNGTDEVWEAVGADIDTDSLTEINENRIPMPDENIVGLKASVKGCIVSEFEAYKILKEQFEKPPITSTDGDITVNMFQSAEHCINYIKLNPSPREKIKPRHMPPKIDWDSYVLKDITKWSKYTPLQIPATMFDMLPDNFKEFYRPFLSP